MERHEKPSQAIFLNSVQHVQLVTIPKLVVIQITSSIMIDQDQLNPLVSKTVSLHNTALKAQQSATRPIITAVCSKKTVAIASQVEAAWQKN